MVENGLESGVLLSVLNAVDHLANVALKSLSVLSHTDLSYLILVRRLQGTQLRSLRLGSAVALRPSGSFAGSSFLDLLHLVNFLHVVAVTIHCET